MQVQVLQGNTVVYTKTITLATRSVASWYQYFTQGFDAASTLVLTDLPVLVSGTVHLVFRGAGTVKVGGVMVGPIYDLGRTLHGPSIGIRDWSQITQDKFGTALVKGDYVKRGSFRTEVTTSQLDTVFSVLASVRATPIFAIGIDSESYKLTKMYGYVKDFSLDLALATVNYCSITIEGLP